MNVEFNLKIAILVLVANFLVAFLVCYFFYSYFFSFLIILFNAICFYEILNYIFSFILKKKEEDFFFDLSKDFNQYVYNFCNIGLILINDEKNIIWFNNKFNNFNSEKNILNKNVFTFFPDLITIFLNNYKDCIIELLEENNEIKHYKVKYLGDIKLFIFYDISNINNLENQIKNNNLVLGIIKIDNYLVFLNYNHDYNNNNFFKIRNLILNYAKEKKILVYPFREDAYLFICNFKIYEKYILKDIENGCFIANQKQYDECETTLSVGISFNSNDIVKLGNFANKAMICAFERGGNQTAIYDCEKEEIFFINNETKNKKNHNELIFFSYGQKILKLIKESNFIFVAGHINGDVDSIASCLSVYSICKIFEKKCFIICDVDTLEKKAKNIVEKLFPDIIENDFLKKSKVKEYIENGSITFNNDDLLIVVDHNSIVNSDLNGLEKEISDSKTIILDHHRRKDRIFKNIFYYIDVNFSSTSEIISMIISVLKIKIEKNIATILLSGILFDSLFLRSCRANLNTFKVIEFLISCCSADKILAFDLLKDNLDETKEIASNLFDNKKNIKICDQIYCYIEEDAQQISFLSKIANSLISIKDIKIVFSIGKFNNSNIYVSCRSDGTENVQAIAEKMGGGGHFDASAFSARKKTINEVLEELFYVLVHDFKKNINICPICFCKLKKSINTYNKEEIFYCENNNCKYITYCCDENKKKKYTTFKNFKTDDYFLNNEIIYDWTKKYVFEENTK